MNKGQDKDEGARFFGIYFCHSFDSPWMFLRLPLDLPDFISRDNWVDGDTSTLRAPHLSQSRSRLEHTFENGPSTVPPISIRESRRGRMECCGAYSPR